MRAERISGVPEYLTDLHTDHWATKQFILVTTETVHWFTHWQKNKRRVKLIERFSDLFLFDSLNSTGVNLDWTRCWFISWLLQPQTNHRLTIHYAWCTSSAFLSLIKRTVLIKFDLIFRERVWSLRLLAGADPHASPVRSLDSLTQ